MTNSKIKMGFIGAGNIVSTRHIPAFKTSSLCELYGVIDINIDKAKNISKQYNILHFGKSLDEKWFEGVDAVSIGVPPHFHYTMAKQALDIGKHVLLEKPMCTQVEEAEELVSLSRKKNRTLAIVHNFQFASSARKLIDIIKLGKIGKIQNILGFQISNSSRRLPEWHEELPFGLLYDEIPHFLYLLRRFGGELEVMQANYIPSTIGKNTPAIITVDLMSEICPCSIYINFESPVCEWFLIIFGEKKLGIIDIFRDILITLPNDGEHQAYEVLRTSFLTGWMHFRGTLISGIKRCIGKLLYGNEIIVNRFIESINSSTQPESISGEDGLSILRTQHNVLALLRKSDS